MIALNTDYSQSNWAVYNNPENGLENQRSWTVLDTALLFIPIIGWLILIIMQFENSSANMEDLALREIKPALESQKKKETAETESLANEKTVELELYRKGLRRLQKDKMTISPQFLQKISTSIKRTQAWIDEQTPELKYSESINTLQSEVNKLQKAHLNLTADIPLSEINISLWDKSFYSASSEPQLNLLFT